MDSSTAQATIDVLADALAGVSRANSALTEQLKEQSETLCAQQKVIEQQYALIQKLAAAKADKTQEALDLAARMSARRGLANEVDMAVGLPGRGPGGN